MRNRWLRWPRSSHDDEPSASVPADLTTAFLEMDHCLAVTQSAVDAFSALNPGSSIGHEWSRVRDASYAVSASYLQFSALASGAEDVGGTSVERAADVRHRIDQARRGIEEFYARHRGPLDGAVAAAAGVTSAADEALTYAQRTRERLQAAGHSWASYPSVQNARDQLATSIQELQLARQRGDVAAYRVAVEGLLDSASALEAALDAAPHRTEEAKRSVASVRTRIDAVRTRAAGVSDVLSTLLREFHANSSSDLLDNERDARISIERGDALLKQAAAALSEGRPEFALELVAQARSAASAAAHLVDAVPDRLAMLRSTREYPEQAERSVRFRLRDAQRLAVDRGAAEEWGSVLDAQAGRIDRAVGALTGRHPDYWRYRSELQEVSDFISEIVSRIRQRSAQ